MKDTVEIPSELAVRLCRAMIDCVDELTAQHEIKYGHLAGSKHPAVQRKMIQDDRARQAAIEPLRELHDLLSSVGLNPVDEIQ